MNTETRPQKALPERYRLARGIDAGYEIRSTCDQGEEHWLPVVKALHINAPAAIVRFELDISGVDCIDGDVIVEHPRTEIMSRRPAVSV